MLKILPLLCLLSFGALAQPTNTNISNGVLFDGEPFIAQNPTNPQNLVAAWMGLKLSGGQFLIAIKTRASFDGGSTWSVANSLPHYASGYGCADVSMGFAATGLLYISYIDSHQVPQDSGGIFVARSHDGGLSWDTPTKAFDVTNDPGKFPLDRPWIAVDHSTPANAGILYITSKPAPWIPAPNRNYYKVSTDSGHTWSPIAHVDGPNYLVGNFIQAPMAAPAVTLKGNFCAIYPSYVTTQNILPTFYLATSRNHGQSFSYNLVIAATPAPNDTNLKNGYVLITSPIDSNKMAFFDPQAIHGDDDIFALHSNDAGQTWSGLVRVNDDTVGNGKHQDLVWAAYNEQGNIACTWRDRRNSAASGFWNAGYDFYYATSADNGQTFSPNQKLSSQFIAFDSLIAQNGNDFMSCVYHADTLYTVWGDTRSGKMNIYFSKTVASTNATVVISLLNGDAGAWEVFPNPAQGQIHISARPYCLQQLLSIYDIHGRKVFSALMQNTTMNINTASFAKGIYFIKIGSEVKRVVVE